MIWMCVPDKGERCVTRLVLPGKVRKGDEHVQRRFWEEKVRPALVPGYPVAPSFLVPALSTLFLPDEAYIYTLDWMASLPDLGELVPEDPDDYRNCPNPGFACALDILHTITFYCAAEESDRLILQQALRLQYNLLTRRLMGHINYRDVDEPHLLLELFEREHVFIACNQVDRPMELFRYIVLSPALPLYLIARLATFACMSPLDDCTIELIARLMDNPSLSPGWFQPLLCRCGREHISPAHNALSNPNCPRSIMEMYVAALLEDENYPGYHVLLDSLLTNPSLPDDLLVMLCFLPRPAAARAAMNKLAERKWHESIERSGSLG